MNSASLFAVIFSGVWCLVGTVFLGVGIGLRRSALRREERLRARAEGTVTEVVRRVGGSDRGSVTWYPIVDFNADGRRVSLECADGGGRKRFYEGQRVEVLYDPEDPACFRLEGNDPGRLTGNIFFGVGLGCIAIGLIAALLVKGLRLPFPADMH